MDMIELVFNRFVVRQVNDFSASVIFEGAGLIIQSNAESGMMRRDDSNSVVRKPVRNSGPDWRSSAHCHAPERRADIMVKLSL